MGVTLSNIFSSVFITGLLFLLQYTVLDKDIKTVLKLCSVFIADVPKNDDLFICSG